MIGAVDLNPGERIIFSGHPSWRSIIGFYLKGLALTGVAALIAAGVTRVIEDEVNDGIVILVFLAGLAITLLGGLIKRISTKYTITNRRLHIKRGIIAREIQETRLERVQNVNHSQSVLERILRVGTVDFDTAAGDDYEFRFAGVANPAGVVAKVDRATESQAGEAAEGVQTPGPLA